MLIQIEIILQKGEFNLDTDENQKKIKIIDISNFAEPIKQYNIGDPIICSNCGINWTKICELMKPSGSKLIKSFNVCAMCGEFLPDKLIIIKEYHKLTIMSKGLDKAKKLIYKSEMVAAVREATSSLENIVRKKSGLDLHGSSLMGKAFHFEYDDKTNVINTEPAIKINDLSTETKRSEQNGIKHLCMGVMQGIRNVFMHTNGNEKIYYGLRILSIVDFLIHQIESNTGITED